MLGPDRLDVIVGRKLAALGLSEGGLERRFFFLAQRDDRQVVTDQLLQDARESVRVSGGSPRKDWTARSRSSVMGIS